MMNWTNRVPDNKAKSIDPLQYDSSIQPDKRLGSLLSIERSLLGYGMAFQHGMDLLKIIIEDTEWCLSIFGSNLAHKRLEDYRIPKLKGLQAEALNALSESNQNFFIWIYSNLPPFSFSTRCQIVKQ